MSEIPRTMKAWIAVGPGQPEDALELRNDWPTPPPPKAGELMIRVSYAALNPGDLRFMSWRIPFKWKFITGMDFVGEVIQVGALASTSTSNVRCGTIVAGAVPLSYIWHGVGTLAEYIVLPAQAVVEKPGDLEEGVAAGLFGIAGQTCVVALRHAKLCKGDRVLVNGASGGVGSLLIQPLCAMGLHVTAVCSGKNEALVRKLGAEEVIDYTACRDLYTHLSSMCSTSGNRPFDAIFDCVLGNAMYRNSPGYLRLDGKYFNIAQGPPGYFTQLMFNNWPVILGGTPRIFTNIFSLPSASAAEDVVKWFKQGWIKEVPVDSVFEFDDAQQAFKKLVSRRAAGKIFVKIK